MGCGEKPSRRGPPRDIVATVNGIALDEVDVAYELKGVAKQPTPEQRRAVLESMVQDELLRQEAVSLGLDEDPEYLEKVRAVAAQLKSMQRKELARLLMKKRVSEASVVSDEEARAYFDTHAPELRTEIHVYQILRRSKDEIEKARVLLASGKPFEEVAATGLPAGLSAEASRPWDLGFMPVRNAPEPWKKPLGALLPGQVSEVISGPKNRYWILQLVDRRQNSTMTFESTKDAIIEALRAERAIRARESIVLELKAKAKVTIQGGAPSQ
ncbi:MAG: peptidyl-prolyl cis-trans isomerase [Deltaproteobacteria bacterium]|nr:peptidyl-prolyl cis-trans isomerase [Deltaproteobacteria bacterium]